MNLRKCGLLIVIVLSLSTGWIRSARAQQTNAWRFAYRASEGGRPALVLVDPSAQPPTAQTISLEGTAAYPYLSRSVLSSPDGEWIAALWSRGDSYAYSHWLLRLYNLRLGQTVDVAEGFSFWSLVTWWSPQLLAWSPDSTQLAFQSKQPPPSDNLQEQTDRTLSVYNVAQAKLTTLLTTQGWDMQFGWSSDSTQLVSATALCPSDHTDPECTVEFSVFDLRAPERPLHTLDLTARGVTVWRQEHPICELKVSPDGQYISFVSNCTYGGVAPHEVYLWDTEVDTVQRVTDFTTSAVRQRPNSNIEGYYRTHWETTTLLISVIYSERMSGEEHRYGQTARVDAATKQLTTLADYAISQWAVNPVSGDLAYAVIPTQPDDGLSFTTATRVQVMRASTALTADMLAQTEALPTGCFPRWSPDGQWLAYEQPHATACQPADPRGFVFYQPATQQTVEYPLPERDLQTYVEAVGWVRIE